MRRPGQRKRTIGAEEAEALGLNVMLFLLEDEGRTRRFLAETGLDAAELREQAGQPQLLAAMLGHLLADESMLLLFSANAGIDPVDVHAAQAALGGGSPWDST